MTFQLKTTIKTGAAFFLTPLLSCLIGIIIVFPFLIFLWGGAGSDFFFIMVMALSMMVMTLIFAYPVMLMVGVPILWLFRKYKITHLFVYAAAGAVVGTMVAAILTGLDFLNAGPSPDLTWLFLWCLGAFYGLVHGVVAWVLFYKRFKITLA